MRRDEVAITNWHFNAWAKYDDWKKDDAAAMPRRNRNCKLSDLAAGTSGRRVVLEGGSIDVNGLGTLLTTEECLLSPVQARNPGVYARRNRKHFSRLPRRDECSLAQNGIAGDDTHGHVDDLARFVNPTPSSPSWKTIRRKPTTRRCRKISLLPEKMKDQDGTRCASKRCRCPSLFFSTGSDSRPATPISISPTASFSCRHSTTPTTRRARHARRLFPGAKSSESRASISFSDWVRYTA